MLNKIETNTNFKALKLSTGVHNFNMSKKAPLEVIDIVKLRRGQDDEFVRQCYDILNENPKTRGAKRENLKNFFSNFLKDTDNKDYILAIKDRSEIVAAYKNNKNEYAINPLKANYFVKNYKFIKDTLFYGLMNDWTSIFYPLIRRRTPENYSYQDIERRNLKNSLITYDWYKPNKIDLYEHLGINKYEI